MQTALCSLVLELSTQLGKSLNPQTLLLALERATTQLFSLMVALRSSGQRRRGCSAKMMLGV